ncbi:MAG: peptide-methionine (S)-S-oxide reductase MsrA [Pseudomonadota bacterium]
MFERFKDAAAVAAILLASAACAAEPETSAAAAPEAPNDKWETAVYAGGCFWCVEADLEKLDGVGDVVSGYAGGESQNPTYRNHEGHLEVVRAPFDPSVISYRELTDYFLRHIDPLDDGGQFCDRGYSYTTAIFHQNPAQQETAEAAVAAAEEELGQSIVTPVRELDAFWIAEDYHQDYYKKNPRRYQFYRTGCRRDARVEAVWGD